jgi:hypothetical protein
VAVIQTVRLLAIGAIAPLAAHFWMTPESRGILLLIAALLCWTLDVIPDYVVALGVIVVWNVAGVGPSEIWAARAFFNDWPSPCCRCFPATFIGQVCALRPRAHRAATSPLEDPRRPVPR